MFYIVLRHVKKNGKKNNGVKNMQGKQALRLKLVNEIVKILDQTSDITEQRRIIGIVISILADDVPRKPSIFSPSNNKPSSGSQSDPNLH